MDSHDNDQSAANGDVAENPSTNELRSVQSDFSTILALLFRRFDLGTHYVYWAPLKYTITVQFMFR